MGLGVLTRGQRGDIMLRLKDSHTKVVSAMAKQRRRQTNGPQRPQSPEQGPSGPAPAAPPPGGPYLQMAFFCEKVLREADGVMSFIRQVDRLTTMASGSDAPAQMPPTTYTPFMAIVIKSGGARGSHEIKLFRERPSGFRDTEPLFSLSVLFEGEERGQGIYGPVAMTFEEEGLYWFDVYVDDTLMTRMPFRVIYQRASARSG